MSVSGLCEICNTASIEHTCGRCGKLVCDRHYDEELGYCLECAADVTGSRPDTGGREQNRPDGVDTYRS